MKSFITGIFVLSVTLISIVTSQTGICYSANPSSEIVNNVYSSTVLITHKKIKTSVWDALRFSAFVAGQVAGTGSFGVGSKFHQLAQDPQADHDRNGPSQLAIYAAKSILFRICSIPRPVAIQGHSFHVFG